MEQWYNSLKEYKFDGWAFGGHSNHLKTILNGIMFLVNKGEFDTSEARPLHVFGTTSMSVIPYIVYAQHLLNERGVNIQLSFDSSCASAEANYGSYIQYCTPTSKVSVAVSNRYDWSLLDNFSKLGCKCPLCRDIDNLEYIFSEEGKGQFYTIIALHNFYQMLSYKRTFEGIVSLNCQEVLDGLPKDLKMNFKAMKKAFSKTGDEGITVIENEIKTRTKKNPLDKSGRSKAICNILGEE
jgi:queuine/archaeosine tRNA-ribosyltransferase